MINLYDSFERNFTHNGVKVFDESIDFTDGTLKRTLKGVYDLELKIEKTNPKAKFFQCDMILKVPTAKGNGHTQLFRIKEVTEDDEEIAIYGQHIFFDLGNTMILNTEVIDRDGQRALDQLLGSIHGGTRFSGKSNIAEINRFKVTQATFLEALCEGKDCFCSKYGGEVDYDNFSFSVDKKIGKDRNVSIRYGKNLTKSTLTTDTSEVITRILPIGADELMLPEVFIDSPLINNYSEPRVKKVEFRDIVFDSEGKKEDAYVKIEDAYAELRRRALELYDEGIDKPKTKIDVGFINLKGFKELDFLESVDIGDVVYVYLPNYSEPLVHRVIEYSYNLVENKFDSCVINNSGDSIIADINSTSNKIDKIESEINGDIKGSIVSEAIKNAQQIIEEGFKDSYVVVRKNEIIIGDAPKIQDMIKCVVFNKNGISGSGNGYRPESLNVAITVDGKICGDAITARSINCEALGTGVITSEDKKLSIDIGKNSGLTVQHTDTETKTSISSEGFYIYNKENETIASLATRSGLTILNAEKVYANNIQVEYDYEKGTMIYVSTSANENIIRDGKSLETAYASLEEAMNDRFYNTNETVINKDIIISIVGSGTLADDGINIEKFSGIGSLALSFSSNITFNICNPIRIRNCSCNITVNGNRSGYDKNDGMILNYAPTNSDNKNAFEVINSNFVCIQGIRTNSETARSGAFIYAKGGNTYVFEKWIDCGKVYVFDLADYGSTIVDYDSCGNTTYNFRVENGGVIHYGSRDGGSWIPTGSTYIKSTGEIYSHGSPSVRASLFNPPPVIITEEYKSWSNNDYGYWSEGYGNWNSNGKKVYQGNWGYGNNRGIFTFDYSSIRSWLSNATPVTGSTISLKRAGSGGYSSAQSIYLWGSSSTAAGGSAPSKTKSYGAIGSLAWGQSGTFSLPVSFVNDLKSGAINSVMFYTGDGSNYIMFEPTCTIKIKAKKSK